ncbi:kynurenine aminotransferase-like isoform X1 [Homarus americanus]|uniref:kynurenine aminotransferase-like isoform X1 n=2 Tax=Homarus americanus TaxID=6706 RepID=UPI001C48B83D|nr:kynurenine aminotransferase-like isoform X1 [Homarus americanus]XP_042243503.1 kynurenine aminotransferase-like isoform X1 [Homarus americanus]
MLNLIRQATVRSISVQPYIFAPVVSSCSSPLPSLRSRSQSCTMATVASPPAIATKTNGIEKSVWVELIQLALEVKPLNLGQGFPDFAAPDTVRKALAEACSSDTNVLLNQYTRGFGHPRLVNALSKLYSKLIGREINPLNEVLVTAGAYEALFVTIMGLVNKGDEVIIIEPFFDCYMPQVKLAGGTPVFVPLCPKKTEGVTSSGDWVLDPTELGNAFTDKTKAIIVNTPNNPLGKVYKREELMMIADLCKKHNSIAIMDEVYEWMTYTGQEHVRMATLPGMWERTISIGSAGKTFSVTGWKIGWAYGPANLMKGLQVVHQHSVYTCTTPVQEAVGQGFEIEIQRYGTPDCYFQSLPAELEVKRNNIVKILTEAGLNPIVPEGGYFILADVRNITSKIDIGGDSNERKDFRFVKWLSRNRKLQGIPPSAFYSPEHGDIGENYIRFCFIKEDENLEKAGEILRTLKKDIDEGKV